MKVALAFAALLFALGGAVPALLLLLGMGLVYASRDPERLMDAAYIAVMLGIGYWAS